MKIRMLFIPWLFLVACSSETPQSGITIIKGATIIDANQNGIHSSDIRNSYLIIKGNQIIDFGEITKSVVFPDTATIIDASGKFIIPGLIDGFAVINNQSYANAFLYSGVTTIIGVDGGRRGDFDYNANPMPDYYMLESVGDEHEEDIAHLNDLERLFKDNFKIALLKYKLKPHQLKQIHERAHEYNMGTIGELGYSSYREGAEIGVDAFVHTTRYSLDAAPKDLRM